MIVLLPPSQLCQKSKKNKGKKMLAANTDSSIEMERKKKDFMQRLHHFLTLKRMNLCLDTEKLGNVLVLDGHNSISDAVTLLCHSIQNENKTRLRISLFYIRKGICPSATSINNQQKIKFTIHLQLGFCTYICNSC